MVKIRKYTQLRKAKGRSIKRTNLDPFEMMSEAIAAGAENRQYADTTRALREFLNCAERECGVLRGAVMLKKVVSVLSVSLESTATQQIISRRHSVLEKIKKRLTRERARVTALQNELAKYKSPKAIGGRVSTAWILRVFLAAPHVSGRALADSFRVAAGFDSTTVSRPSILKIKAAWVEMYTRMVFKVCREWVEAHMNSSKRNGRKFAVLTVTHIQDEADLRLRSAEARDGPKMPRRARASKVQLQVVTLAAGPFRREIPTELEALGDKTAGTLATVLEATMRRTLQESLPDRSPSQPEIWAIIINKHGFITLK